MKLSDSPAERKILAQAPVDLPEDAVLRSIFSSRVAYGEYLNNGQPLVELLDILWKKGSMDLVITDPKVRQELLEEKARIGATTDSVEKAKRLLPFMIKVADNIPKGSPEYFDLISSLDRYTGSAKEADQVFQAIVYAEEKIFKREKPRS